jgi:hypothetical protein
MCASKPRIRSRRSSAWMTVLRRAEYIAEGTVRGLREEVCACRRRSALRMRAFRRRGDSVVLVAR